MKIIDTQKIEHWPGEVLLGHAQIRDDLPDKLLRDSELKEYQAFHHPNRKAEYLTARYLFKFLVDHSGLDFSSVELLKQQDGKPFFELAGGHSFVSFSHTNSHVFCAISKTLDVGIDAELTTRIINPKVIKRILSKPEQAYLDMEDPIKLWTIKEAAVKCLGTGLRTNLNEVIIQKNEGDQYSVRFNDEYLFEICSFTQLNHQIALAYQSQ